MHHRLVRGRDREADVLPHDLQGLGALDVGPRVELGDLARDLHREGADVEALDPVDAGLALDRRLPERIDAEAVGGYGAETGDYDSPGHASSRAVIPSAFKRRMRRTRASGVSAGFLSSGT